jgi:hypothetical protein
MFHQPSKHTSGLSIALLIVDRWGRPIAPLITGDYDAFLARDMVKKVWRGSFSQRFDGNRLASVSYCA